jgi:hypothetical protein
MYWRFLAKILAFFGENIGVFANILAFLAQSTACLIITLDFEKKRQFFSPKIGKNRNIEFLPVELLLS